MTLWNESYGIVEVNEPLDEVNQIVNELCGDFIVEQVNYTEWKRNIAEVNKEYKKYGIKVKNNISKTKLIEVSHALHGPEGLIEVDADKYQANKDKEKTNGTNNAISRNYLPF